MRSRLFATCFVITVCPIALSTGTIASTAPAASHAQIALHELQQDVAVAELLDTLRVRALHGHVLFRDVRVVNPDTGTVAAGQAVLVSGRTIQWVGNDAAAAQRAASFRALAFIPSTWPCADIRPN